MSGAARPSRPAAGARVRRRSRRAQPALERPQRRAMPRPVERENRKAQRDGTAVRATRSRRAADPARPSPRAQSALARGHRSRRLGRTTAEGRAAPQRISISTARRRVAVAGILAGPRVAGVARMRTRGDLQADAVPGGEAVPERPQGKGHPPARRRRRARSVPARPGPARRRRSMTRRARRRRTRGRTGRSARSRPAPTARRAPGRSPRRVSVRVSPRVDEHVVAGLELAVVDHRLAAEQHRAADRRGRVRRVIPVAVVPRAEPGPGAVVTSRRPAASHSGRSPVPGGGQLGSSRQPPPRALAGDEHPHRALAH